MVDGALISLNINCKYYLFSTFLVYLLGTCLPFKLSQNELFQSHTHYSVSK